MKILKLKEKLDKKNGLIKRAIKQEYSKNINNNSLCNLKIIGITGSRGKSTTGLIIHEYLKSLGYKSVLYSSIMIDSPASHYNKKDACEVVMKNESDLISIIGETEAYGADYLILEVNDSVLEKGFLKNVPFDVRILTNLNPKHNLDRYSEDEYVKIKKSFFEGIEDDCKCIIGFQHYDKSILEELLKLNNYPKFITASTHVAGIRGVNLKDVSCLLTELITTIDGIIMTIKLNEDLYTIKTKTLMKYNAFNIMNAVMALEVLGLFDERRFKMCLQKVEIPGRAEIYRVNGRMIVIDSQLPAMLECLQEFKEKQIISQIKVVVGAIGYGYQNWEERFKRAQEVEKRKAARKYAMELLKGAVDYVYLTECDNGKESVLEICSELKGYLGDKVISSIILDRRMAIEQAINESSIGDVIFISGRGNKKVLCDGERSSKLFKDSDVVKETLATLKWK